MVRVTAVVLLLLTLDARAFVLITAEEARQYNQESSSLIAPASSPTNALPAIDVINPQIMSGPVPSPVSIELSFRTDDAVVDLASFKALYGSFKLNITHRIMERASATPGGLRIENAEIPSGTHRLFLSIADSKGRRSDRELRIQVR